MRVLDEPRAIGKPAELLGVTQQAASKSVLELESLGDVERLADGDDSRIRRVALSPRGRAVIERGRAVRAQLEAELLADVGPRALASARRAVLSLRAHTGGFDAVATPGVKPPSL